MDNSAGGRVAEVVDHLLLFWPVDAFFVAEAMLSHESDLQGREVGHKISLHWVPGFLLSVFLLQNELKFERQDSSQVALVHMISLLDDDILKLVWIFHLVKDSRTMDFQVSWFNAVELFGVLNLHDFIMDIAVTSDGFLEDSAKRIQGQDELDFVFFLSNCHGGCSTK